MSDIHTTLTAFVSFRFVSQLDYLFRRGSVQVHERLGEHGRARGIRKPVEEGWLSKFQIYKAKGRSITFILFIGLRYAVDIYFPQVTVIMRSR